MSEARNVPFDSMEWSDDVPGIRAKEAEVDNARWAIVEYEKGAKREEWCEDGHCGFVVMGEIHYEFDDGRNPLHASEGEAFFLPPAPLGEGAHRGMNLADKPTRLFLTDIAMETE